MYRRLQEEDLKWGRKGDKSSHWNIFSLMCSCVGHSGGICNWQMVVQAWFSIRDIRFRDIQLRVIHY